MSSSTLAIGEIASVASELALSVSTMRRVNVGTMNSPNTVYIIKTNGDQKVISFMQLTSGLSC